MDGKLIQVADLKQNQDGKISVAIFDEAVKQIIRANDLMSKTVVVMCTAGPSRTGKSFLVNLLLHYAWHKENKKKTEWINSDKPIKGVEWSRKPRPVTYGVWIWNKPLKVSLKDNKKAYILMMDTQGLNAEGQSTRMDKLLLTITLQLHDLLLYNVKEPVRNSDISLISNLLKTWTVKMRSEPTFNHLLFLYRDWSSDDELGFRPNMFKEKAEEAKRDPDSLYKYEAIGKAFKNVSSFTVPHPGTDLVRKSESENLTLKGGCIDEVFLSTMQKLFGMIAGYQDGNDYFKNIHEHAFTGIDILSKVQTIKKWIECEKWVNGDEAIAHLYLNAKVEDISNRFEEQCSLHLQQNLEPIFKGLQNFIPPDKADYQRKFIDDADEYVETTCFSTYEKMLEDQLESSEEEYRSMIEKIKSFKTLKEVEEYLTKLEQGALESEDASQAKRRLKIFGSVAGVFAAGALAAGLVAALGPFAILGTALFAVGAGVSGTVSLAGIAATIRELVQNKTNSTVSLAGIAATIRELVQNKTNNAQEVKKKN